MVGCEILGRDEPAGLDPETDIRKQSLGATQSVDALKDQKNRPFFWSGGLPTGSVLNLATTPGRTIRLIPNAETLSSLHEKYGSIVYQGTVIPRSTYLGIEVDVPVIAVANVLAVHERMSEELAYGITKVLFERRADLVVIHSEAENLTLESAIVGSPISFHDGAVRYYREQQAWWDSRRWDELLFTSSGRVRSKGFPLALSHGTKPARELFQLAEAPVEHVVHLRDRDGRRSAPGRL